MTDAATTIPIATAHSLFGAVSFPVAGSPKYGVEAEPDDDHQRADHLATTDVLPRQEVAEREREDDGRDEERLDDRDPAAIERACLEDIAGEKCERPEEPPRLPDETHERLRVGERDRREIERPLLLQRCRKRKEERRDECEDFGHRQRLRQAPMIGKIRRRIETVTTPRLKPHPHISSPDRFVACF